MRRELPLPNKIKQINPWFWKTCCYCHNQFKKEFGWKVKIHIYADDFRSSFYLCKHCASTDITAKYIFELKFPYQRFEISDEIQES